MSKKPPTKRKIVKGTPIKATAPIRQEAEPEVKIQKEVSTVGRRRWTFDLEGWRNVNISDNQKPAGFITGDFTVEERDSRATNRETKAELIYKSAMAVATAPGKQLFMTCFMLYMSGSSLQIFSIMMLAMAIMQPLQRMTQLSAQFAKYQDSKVDVTLPKIIYMICNLFGLGIAVYKAQTMGLVPTSWQFFIPTPLPPTRLQFTSGGVSF